ncbi:MAG: RES domain-containing protein [Xenococcus sp. MO_188.B8]|nr:RES domain-containing protein [Xenococcus sp. MO_188.B8]
MVEITFPPPDPQISVSPVFEILTLGSKLRRIFDPTKYDTQATSFRHYGPIGRFDHQRGSLDKPNYDAERGINYWGFELSCCLVEVFGDTRVIETENKEVALVELTKSIKLLDLRGSGAMKAGTVSAITQTAQRNLSQAWSSYFYEYPELYGEIDGLLFNNAHNNEAAIALYERARPQLDAAKIDSLPLEATALYPAISDCAIKNNLIFDY